MAPGFLTAAFKKELSRGLKPCDSEESSWSDFAMGLLILLNLGKTADAPMVLCMCDMIAYPGLDHGVGLHMLGWKVSD